MTETRDNFPKLHLSTAGDNFKLIRGIGPVSAKRLNEAGIRTFTQLAELSPEAIAEHLPNLKADQVRNQEWILQARRLASSHRRPSLDRKQKNIPTNRQHYENFTLEFLLNEKNKIHRLRITHIQSGDVDTWTRWNADEISSFLARHTGARLTHRVPRVSPRNKNKASIEPSISPTESEAAVDNNTLSSLALSAQTTSIPAEVNPVAPPVHTSQKEAVHPIRLLDWRTLLPGSNENLRTLPQSQDFEVCLTLEIAGSALTAVSLMDITGEISSKKVGDGSRQLIGKVHTKKHFSPILILMIKCSSLLRGLYRLEAAIEIKPVATDYSSTQIAALIEGKLMQIY